MSCLAPFAPTWSFLTNAYSFYNTIIRHLQDGMTIGSSLYDEEGAKIVPDILKKVHCLQYLRRCMKIHTALEGCECFKMISDVYIYIHVYCRFSSPLQKGDGVMCHGTVERSTLGWVPWREDHLACGLHLLLQVRRGWRDQGRCKDKIWTSQISANLKGFYF